MNLRQKILALAVVPLLVAILAITALVTHQSTELSRASLATFERSLLKAKENELLNLTNMAISAISEIYEAAGPDDEGAKRQVQVIQRRTLSHGFLLPGVARQRRSATLIRCLILFRTRRSECRAL